MTRQYQLPGGPVISETGTRQYQLPGGPVISETSSSSVTLDIGVTETSDTVAVAVNVDGSPVTVDVGYTETSDTVAVAVTVASSSVTVDVGYTEASDTVLAAVNVAGVLTTRKFHNNTGLAGVRANVANVTLNIYNPTTGALVAHLTGLTTTAEGRLVVSHASLVIGTSYAYEPDFTASGFGRRLPVGTAA